MILKDGLLHFIRPGALLRELPALDSLRPTYHAFIMNAPTIAWDPGVAARFLKSFNPMVPFIIDPKTYALARDPDAVKKKQSWHKLAPLYGYDLGVLPLQPTMQSEELKRLVNLTLNFQRNCFPAEGQQLSFFLANVTPEPAALVAPYFLFSGYEDPWFRVNLELASLALQETAGGSLLTTLLFDRRVLQDPDQISRVAGEYAALGASGHLVWVEDAAESTWTPREIFGFRMMVDILGKSGQVPVVNMFGGYLSALLYRWGLSGFSHYIYGGEKRPADPAGGGKVPVMFYVPPLHQLKPAQLVDDYLERVGILSPEDYFRRICSCQVCRHALECGIEGFMKTFADPVIDMKELKPKDAPESQAYAIVHYMLARHREIQAASTFERSALLTQLLANARDYQDPAASPIFDTQHLRSWAQGLSAKDWEGFDQ